MRRRPYRKQQIPMAARNRTPPATPTPIPIFAPVERPDGDEVAEGVAREAVWVALVVEVASADDVAAGAELVTNEDVAGAGWAGGVESV